MAAVQRKPKISHDNVFNSVFSKASIKPPTSQPSKPQARIDVIGIVAVMEEDSRAILGIGDENNYYAQGESPWFGAYAPLCPPINEIRKPDVTDYVNQRKRHAELRIWKMLKQWQSTCGAIQIKKLLASVLDRLLTEFIQWSYTGYYGDNSQQHLHFWIQHVFAPYIHQFLSCLDSDGYLPDTPSSKDTDMADVRKWQEMAITRLGALRVDELFGIVVEWPSTTNSIQDLKTFTTNPATRSYLTSSFTNALSKRLLHPGASTIEILQIYINTIRAFRELDLKGVLLERVARRIRRYLRERDDTVKVIITGLLSDVSEHDNEINHANIDTLSELAVELNRRDTDNPIRHSSELDWNNMSWVPDPIDAAPDYLKSKSTDVIGSLISLFDSKEVFVRELQSTLASRLLQNKPDFDQEISVLEHLKIRFGDAALQGCEVMLRDVLDSRKVDNVIRKDQGMQDDLGSTKPDSVSMHAKILSRLFWPSFADQPFKVPDIILAQQAKYSTGFESLKQTRKLTWLNNLGQVEVELELTDRTIHEHVSPWQASVIYAFQGDTAGEAESVRKTIASLSSSLEMSSTLVRSACIFWTSKRVLAESGPDTFSVLETLPTGSEALRSAEQQPAAISQAASAAAAAAAEAEAQAAREAEDEERTSEMAVYGQFIVSMVTNQGAMPLPRIAMMLNMVVPGGFNYGNEELKEFLGRMVKDGMLELGHNGAYKKAG